MIFASIVFPNLFNYAVEIIFIVMNFYLLSGTFLINLSIPLIILSSIFLTTNQVRLSVHLLSYSINQL